MTSLRAEVRRGTYADSVRLMQLQARLAEQEGVVDAGVVMGTAANLELLASSGLSPTGIGDVGNDDLIIVVEAVSLERASEVLTNVDRFLAGSGDRESIDYRPKSLKTAVEMRPDANWALLSTPGRWTADIANEALDYGLNVFIYSDNVDIDDEIALKSRALEMGRMVLGPDCGTSIVDGVGFGFANRVRQGPIGVVAASGTGIQAVTSRVHELGSGISHAIGTGGRDLSSRVGGLAAQQALSLLGSDDRTAVVALVSKPPEAEVASQVLRLALSIDKPVVVHFLGYAPPAVQVRNLWFTRTLSEAAEVAVDLATADSLDIERQLSPVEGNLYGLFAGGTLALEALQGLLPFLRPIASNLSAGDSLDTGDPLGFDGHSIIDLGADDFTVGRLHPMIDQRLRIQLLERLAERCEPAVVLLDVVLGAGSHDDPAGELASVVRRLCDQGHSKCVVIVVGTDEDPQDLTRTATLLEEAGARVVPTVDQAVELIVAMLVGRAPGRPNSDPALLDRPIAINLGLEPFYQDLIDQQVAAVHVDWRPPAGGDQRLISILERMKP